KVCAFACSYAGSARILRAPCQFVAACRSRVEECHVGRAAKPGGSVKVRQNAFFAAMVGQVALIGWLDLRDRSAIVVSPLCVAVVFAVGWWATPFAIVTISLAVTCARWLAELHAPQGASGYALAWSAFNRFSVSFALGLLLQRVRLDRDRLARVNAELD